MKEFLICSGAAVLLTIFLILTSQSSFEHERQKKEKENYVRIHCKLIKQDISQQWEKSHYRCANGMEYILND